MKERIKTATIAVLLVLTAALAGRIWIAPASTGKKLIKTVDPKLTESVTGRIVPASAVINFGEGRHTKIYQLKNLWPFYRNILKQQITEGEDIEWERLDYNEYLKCHDVPSVLFELENHAHSEIFKKIYHIDGLKGHILRMYFSEAEGILFETDQGVFRSKKWTPLSDIDKYIRSLAQENLPQYTSLWERYGIASAVYLPSESVNFEGGIVYLDELKQMERVYKNNLVERLLNTSIEEVHIIREEESNLYVSGKRTVRLWKNGVLDYKNNTETTSVVMEPTGAIQLAYEFLEKATGSVDNIELKEMKAIGDGKRKGYSLQLNYTEKGLGVVPIKDGAVDYIAVDVFDNRVESVKYLYRNKDMRRGEESVVSALSFDALVEANPEIFGLEEQFREQMKQLKRFDLVYLDQAGEDKSPLGFGYVLQFGEKSVLFDAVRGAVIGGDGR